ncbi:hypothetical protein PENTCL1PPCAC_13265, partial [Pristionchus entomophagus]
GEDINGDKLRADSEKCFENVTPQCVLFEAYPKTTTAYAYHLDSQHKSTLISNGIYLLCSCGFEIRSCYLSKKHNKCDSSLFTFRKIEKKTPQCVLCEIYPATASAYTQHLYLHHKSTLIANGVYLLCACGIKVGSIRNGNHFEKCDGRLFSLHKLEKIPKKKKDTFPLQAPPPPPSLFPSAPGHMPTLPLPSLPASSTPTPDRPREILI